MLKNGLLSFWYSIIYTGTYETVKTHRRRMLQKNNIGSFPHLVYLMNKEV